MERVHFSFIFVNAEKSSPMTIEKKLYHIKEGMALLKTDFLPNALIELVFGERGEKGNLGKYPLSFPIFL